MELDPVLVEVQSMLRQDAQLAERLERATLAAVAIFKAPPRRARERVGIDLRRETRNARATSGSRP